MATRAQMTNIDVIGDMATWGTHFCLFYETKEDLLDVLISFCKSGLEKGEYCLWIVAEPLTIEEATFALKEAVPDLDHYLADSRIEIVRARDVFLQGGKLDGKWATDVMYAKLADVSARSYPGIRVTGDTNWLTKEDWTHYCQIEEGVNAAIGGQRLVVLCTFPLVACGPFEILDTVRAHQFVVVRRQGNWEIVESAALKRAKAEIQRFNDELEQRVAERTNELMKAEQRYRVMIETASDAVVSMDESGAILIANPAAKVVFGYEPGELAGKPVTVLMPEFLRKVHEDGFRRYLATGQRHLNWEGTELTGLRKNGQEFPVAVSFGEVMVDGHRIFTGFIRDISEKKRAEDAMRRSEAYLTEAQKVSHTGSWHWNVATGELLWSQEFFVIFGFDPEQTKPSYTLYLERIHPDDRSRVEEARWEAVKAKRDFDLEYRVLLPSGAIKYVHSMGRCSADRSGNVEYIGAMMDVTERKRAEEERERLRQAQSDLAYINRISTMGELAASLAHEIKQPISAAMTDAKTCSRWLTRDQPDLAEAQASASRVVKDVARASEIVSRVRSLFKKESLQHEEVDINEVIQEMIALLRGEASRHSISIDSDIAPDLPPIMADRVQLQQVFMNLMLNGIEAMKNTNTPGKLTVSSQLDDSGQLLISVMDTGIGVPPEKTEQIFNAFFTSKPQGTGMGLPISRSIIESHGGRLWVISNPGSGATFQFTLPILCTAHQAA